MSALLEVIQKTKTMSFEIRRQEVLNKMIEKGQQIPLSKFMSNKQIKKLDIKHHVLLRFKQRFERLYDIEIENTIKQDLIDNAMIVGMGHSNRWQVHSKGMIFIMDEHAIYTTYDASGRDRNNIIDPTKAKLRRINRKTREQRRLEYLFSKI